MIITPAEHKEPLKQVDVFRYFKDKVNPLGNIVTYTADYGAISDDAIHFVWQSSFIRDPFASACFHRTFLSILGDRLMEATEGAIPLELTPSNHLVARVSYKHGNVTYSDGIVTTPSTFRFANGYTKAHVAIFNDAYVFSEGMRYFPLRLSPEKVAFLMEAVTASFYLSLQGLYVLSINQHDHI